MSAFLDAALSYAARGWPVLPLRGKIPTTPHGVKDATTDEATIKEWWRRSPTANVGIACGKASGLLVVDVDARSGGLETIAGYDLAPCPLSVATGGGGLHLYYRWPDVAILGGKGRFGPGVDCQGEGRYVVAPPSIHPETGQAYRWASEGECDPLPNVLADVATRTRETLPALTASRAVTLSGGDVVERARRYVSQMRESTSGQGGHDSLFRVCCAVVCGFGLDLESARAVVLDYNATKASPPWSDKEIAHKLADAEKAGTFNGRPRGCLLADRDRQELTPVAAVVLADRKRREQAASLAPPDHLLEPPGLVGEVARHIDACSVHRVPLLAVAGALCAVATACGRHYRTPTGARPVLYVVGVAESGVGKETSRQCSIALLRAAGLSQRVGSDDVSSAAALTRMLHDHPVRLLLLDELGRMLEAYSSRSAASFERQIVTALIRLWSSADGAYLGKAMADKGVPEPIVEPHLSMYGTTTPGSLYRSLKGADMADGVLSRMLLVPIDHGRQRRATPTASRSDPPPGLVEQMKALSAPPAGSGNMASVEQAGGKTAIDVQLDDGALDLLESITDYTDGALESDRAHRELWVRAEEQAQRVALVLALGCGARTIERGHLSWAWDIVRWSIGRTREIVARHVAEGPEDAARQAILRALDPGALTQHALTRAMQRVDRRTREAALSTLLDGGVVVRQAVRTRGRERQVYRLATTAEIADTTEIAEEDAPSSSSVTLSSRDSVTKVSGLTAQKDTTKKRP